MMYGQNKACTATSFYSIKDRLIDGMTEVSMNDYAGNPVVVVNVASK